MKCSECSKVVKPVVSVDIDGTLGKYHEHFTKFAEKYVGADLPWMYRGGQEFSEYLGLSKELYRDIKLAYRQGGMKRSMPIYYGAREFMNALRIQGIEVWIVTTRPWMRLDNIDPDTRFWLTHNGIKWDYMLYGDDKYDQLLERVDNERIIAVIDDLHNECVTASYALDGGTFAEVDSRVFQPMRRHNDGEQWMNRFMSFERQLDIILSELEQWNHANI